MTEFRKNCITDILYNSMDTRKYSDYFMQQDKYIKQRYVEKLSCIGPLVDDPYVLPIPTVTHNYLMSEVEYPDIYNYLIFLS